MSNSKILPASDLQVFSGCFVQVSPIHVVHSQPISSSVISPTSSSQVSSICFIRSQPISNSGLSASSSQVSSMCFAHSNSQDSASPMHLIHPQSGSQVSLIYPIQQEYTFEMLATDNIENSALINSGISDMNKDSDINENLNLNKNSVMNEDSNMNEDQNIEFNNQEKLEIVPIQYS
ncbi:hypothetical protein C2G38_2166577 [Gigaspora rosea]|uniref:Uncharacterized protein n=1 Tax=Gigaspora rosea TaxID=44941 RepID=A0A397W1J5_9GLOM|nr:hypothetical protein C2G38_2166577 [Gigaspora rosea]